MVFPWFSYGFQLLSRPPRWPPGNTPWPTMTPSTPWTTALPPDAGHCWAALSDLHVSILMAYMALSENVGYIPNEIAIKKRDNDQQNHWV